MQSAWRLGTERGSLAARCCEDYSGAGWGKSSTRSRTTSWRSSCSSTICTSSSSTRSYFTMSPSMATNPIKLALKLQPKTNSRLLPLAKKQQIRSKPQILTWNSSNFPCTKRIRLLRSNSGQLGDIQVRLTISSPWWWTHRTIIRIRQLLRLLNKVVLQLVKVMLSMKGSETVLVIIGGVCQNKEMD